MMRPTNAAGKENEANIATGHVSTHLKEKNFVEMCNKITFVPIERSVHVKQKIIDGGKKGLNGTIFQKLGKENTNVTIEYKGNYNKSAGIRNQLHYEESENGNQNSIIKLPNEILSDSYADSGHHQRYENSVLFQESSTEEYHIIIPSNMRRERRSRNERSKSKTSRSGYDNPQSDNNANYCSVRNTSNDCSNQYSSDVLQNQNHNQTRVSTARAKTSHRARNNHLGYASKEKENIFSSYRSTKKDESLLLDSYRSLQERTVNKSCENDRYNFKELHDNQDPKIRSIYRMLNSLGKNRPDTYRERSENRKASKLGVNQSVCLSNRNNRSILGRESQQTQRRSTVDNLKAGYKDIANKSKLEKKELIFKRENGGIEIESKDSSTQRNWENKALKPTNLNKGLEGSGKNMVFAEETKVIISKERKIINNYHSAKENSKVAKFPNPKTTLESTYYEEFIRKKKLNEKLLQPRSRNSQSISQEKVLTKKSEMKRLENRQEIKKETKKPDQNKTIQSNYKRNMENKETLSVDNKLYDSEYDSAKTKKSTLMGPVNLNRHQNPNALSRLDRVVDKTIVEKTYVEKAQIKNKVYIGNPSINLSTNRSKRDNFESLIEEEQSQAENLTYRGDDWPSHPNSVRENSLWDKVAENYGIDIEEITREWEKLAENQLQSRRQNELENKDTVSGQVSDHMKAQEPKINYHLQKEEESSKAKEEEKTKVNESNETNLTWDIIRKIEDKAARKIQEFFVDRLQKIRNNKSLKLNKISYINLDDNKLLFEAYKDYENLYQKIADVIGDQIINKDKNDLAMAFVAAYSCLNSSYLSADEAQSLIQKVISSYE